jgi:L-serine/L-threonine ammonia-lyase
MLVELACSTTLAPAYKPSLLSHLVSPLESSGNGKRNIVFIVCGGFKISQTDLVSYGNILQDDAGSGNEWDIMVDGEKLRVSK